jgi:hypothetical protein
MTFDEWCNTHGMYLNDPDDGAKAARLMANQAWDAAVAAERERWRMLISGPHEYNGDCPDGYNLHRRDPECRACAALGEWRA